MNNRLQKDWKKYTLGLCLAAFITTGSGIPLSAVMAASNSSDTTQTQSGQNAWELLVANSQLDLHANNPRVKQKIAEYTRYKRGLQKMIDSASPFIYYIYLQAKKRNMPVEVALLPFVESSFNPYAMARDGGAGLWQFMIPTARGFDMKINAWYDGRRDIYTSTQAALDYLQQLYKKLGSWELALASYNTGAGNVHAAIKRNERSGKSADYWSLHLNRITDVYVPKLFAIAYILKNHKRYGIQFPDTPAQLNISRVTLKSQLAEKEILRLSGVNDKTYHTWNMGFRRSTQQPGKTYTLELPTQNANRLAKNLTTLSGQPHATWQSEKVKRTQSVESFAAKYGVSVAELKKANDLKGSKVRAGQKILVPEYSKGKYAKPVSVKKLSGPSYATTALPKMVRKAALAPVGAQSVAAMETVYQQAKQDLAQADEASTPKKSA